MPHIPVLLQTVCEYLLPKPGDLIIDATAGQGGYSQRLLELVGPTGKVLMLDWDNQAVALLRKRFRAQLESGQGLIVSGNFADLGRIAKSLGFQTVQGIVFDFGTSRLTLEDFGKGFSFNRDEPLLMTYSQDAAENAEQVVNVYPEQKLKQMFSEYGQERFSGRIAAAIVRARNLGRIKTAKQLAEIIAKAVPRRPYRLHPATRVFQAIRIQVNHELENIRLALPQAVGLLAPRGRVVAVSYNSLEDRIVKQAFRDFSRQGIAKLITVKPVVPNRTEIAANPSSRSAKLRCLEKII